MCTYVTEEDKRCNFFNNGKSPQPDLDDDDNDDVKRKDRHDDHKTAYYLLHYAFVSTNSKP